MRYQRFIFPVFVVILSLTLAMVWGGCANIVPPEGGFKDTLAPRLLRVIPDDDTRNFDAKKIVFSFDEYVDLVENGQKMEVSPVPKVPPRIGRKLRTVTINLRDTLEPNTTYSINLKGVVKDVNESNEMEDMIYVFSTGATIDSMELSGNVIMAEDGKIDSTLTVMLHRSGDDSAVVKEKPRYATRVDRNGHFHFQYLQPGTYYIYALKNEGGGYRYTNVKQAFAFGKAPIVLQGSAEPVELYAYTSKEPERAGSKAPPKRAPADRRLKYQTNAGSAGKQDLLTRFSFTFETPLRSFDSTGIKFYTDTLYTPITSGFNWSLDSTKKILSFNYPWVQDTLYHFIMDTTFATDTLGFKLLRSDTISFKTMAKLEYGELSIRFKNLELSENPVIFFVQGNEVKYRFPLTGPTFKQPLFIPGDYELRLLKDKNKNGTWDPGDFWGNKEQPELVKPIGKKVIVRANWQNETEIDITAPVVNESNDPRKNGQAPLNNNNRSNPPQAAPTRSGRILETVQ
jgi:hypothetical protein